MPKTPQPDRFDLRMAYDALRVERSWRCTFEEAMQLQTLQRLIHTRAVQVLRRRAARMERLQDIKQLAAEGQTE